MTVYLPALFPLLPPCLQGRQRNDHKRAPYSTLTAHIIEKGRLTQGQRPPPNREVVEARRGLEAGVIFGPTMARISSYMQDADQISGQSRNLEVLNICLERADRRVVRGWCLSFRLQFDTALQQNPNSEIMQDFSLNFP
jgi:hypothetical protein